MEVIWFNLILQTSDNYLYASVGENARDLANNSSVCKVGSLQSFVSTLFAYNITYMKGIRSKAKAIHCKK